MGLVNCKIVNGEMETIEFTRPVGEMIATPAGIENIIQRTMIDLQLGRERKPLIYGPIYDEMVDPNFSTPVDVAGFANAQVVFLETLEGEGVKMGHYKVGSKGACPIVTYTGGLEWTEDMVRYNQTWNMTKASQAMGEGYNAKMNHIHLDPILSFTYAAKNKTAASSTGSERTVKLRNTFKDALAHAADDENTDTKTGRTPTILLAHSTNRWDIEECLQRMTVGGTVFPAISQIETLIFYKGDSVTVGGKTYTYPGVATTKAYLIDPKKYFKSLVKDSLQIDSTGADLRRLIADAVVGRSRIGVYAAPANGVEEVTLPS